MRKSEYIKWFSNTRALFMEYIGDNDIADELLHYEIFLLYGVALKMMKKQIWGRGVKRL